MNIKQSKVFSLDLGNSTCRMGLFDGDCLSNERFVSTTSFVDNPKTLLDEIAAVPAPLAYCSVSPLAEQSLKEWAGHSGLEPFNLSNG